MKVQIDLPPDVYQQLKLDAKEKFQSLRGHITYRLIELIRGKDKNVIDLSTLPDNTTIKTTTSKTATKKSSPHRDLIKEAEEGEFFPNSIRVHGYDDEPFTNDEYDEEILHTYPVYVRKHPDYQTLKNYYDSFVQSEEERSEARERFIALHHSPTVRSHEALYLEQVFDFIPPGDDTTIDLCTYIERLTQGGWYDDDTIPHIIPKE